MYSKNFQFERSLGLVNSLASFNSPSLSSYGSDSQNVRGRVGESLSEPSLTSDAALYRAMKVSILRYIATPPPGRAQLSPERSCRIYAAADNPSSMGCG